MSVILDLLPLTKVTDQSWWQPRTQVADVGDFSQVALFFFITKMTVVAPSTTINIATDVENVDDLHLVTIDSLQYAASGDNINEYRYLSGALTPQNGKPGFGRYLRIGVTQSAGASLVLAVKAVFKR